MRKGIKIGEKNYFDQTNLSIYYRKVSFKNRFLVILRDFKYTLSH